MILVQVRVGVGAWTAATPVTLVACPHTGDMLVVGEQTVRCDRVYIYQDHVKVEETRHFQSAQEAEDFFK